ncbi:DUF1648 domain-containing protein [Cytobacillus sp. NJ13]|nr:DUF1648 domain-containing protein [Cytobacillus sp. NJ13]
MIRKIIAWLIVVIAFGISFYFNKDLPSVLPSKFANLNGTPTEFAPKSIILFIIPVTMIISSLSLFIVTQFRWHSEVVRRLDKSLGTVSLVLNSVLLILHCALIYVGLGNNFNMLLLLPIIVGIVFVIIGNTLPRFKLESLTGTNSLQNATYNLWNEVSRPIAYTLFISGIVMLLSVLLPKDLVFGSFLIILLLTVVVALFFAYTRFSRSAKID